MKLSVQCKLFVLYGTTFDGLCLILERVKEESFLFFKYLLLTFKTWPNIYNLFRICKPSNTTSSCMWKVFRHFTSLLGVNLDCSAAHMTASPIWCQSSLLWCPMNSQAFMILVTPLHMEPHILGNAVYTATVLLKHMVLVIYLQSYADIRGWNHAVNVLVLFIKCQDQMFPFFWWFGKSSTRYSNSVTGPPGNRIILISRPPTFQKRNAFPCFPSATIVPIITEGATKMLTKVWNTIVTAGSWWWVVC